MSHYGSRPPPLRQSRLVRFLIRLVVVVGIAAIVVFVLGPKPSPTGIRVGEQAPPLVGTPAYADATYYCAQAEVEASCAMSPDGGLTFDPAVPIYTTDCIGLHTVLRMRVPVSSTVSMAPVRIWSACTSCMRRRSTASVTITAPSPPPGNE